MMKKLLSLVLAVLLLVSATTAFAAGKLNVVQENFHNVPGLWTYGYAYAKVENSGDKPIKINAGVLELYDEEGEVITSTDYLQAYARYLEPGEYTYVEMYDEIEEEGVSAADYSMTLTGKSDKEYTCLRLTCEPSLQMNVEDGWWTYNYMYALVTNNTDAPVYDLNVVFALMDAEGNIIHIEDHSMYSSVALMPGSSITVRLDISSSFMEYFEANNITPASLDAIAYAEISNE